MTAFLSKTSNRLIGQAMHAYDMLSDNDRVMIAVSGGIDSLVLSWILDHWRRKAPIHYHILAVHVDMGYGDKEHELIRLQLKKLHIPCHVIYNDFGRRISLKERPENACYTCARKRRNILFDFAGQEGFTKIAFGHHKDDIIETFFLNLLFSGNISTMMPKQDLFSGELAIIRPMAFLEKSHIQAIGDALLLSPVPNPCPFSEKTKRLAVRNSLATLYSLNPDAKANIFAALGNIKPDYLLKK